MTENYPLSQNKLLEDANNIRSLTGSISYMNQTSFNLGGWRIVLLR